VGQTAGYTESPFRNAIYDVMSEVVCARLAPLDDYLLLDDSPLLRAYVKKCKVRAALKAGQPLDAVRCTGGVISVNHRHPAFGGGAGAVEKVALPALPLAHGSLVVDVGSFAGPAAPLFDFRAKSLPRSPCAYRQAGRVP